MEESVLTLVRLVQKFTFSLDTTRHDGSRLLHSSLITYMPRDGIWLHVQPREILLPPDRDLGYLPVA